MSITLLANFLLFSIFYIAFFGSYGFIVNEKVGSNRVISDVLSKKMFLRNQNQTSDATISQTPKDKSIQSVQKSIQRVSISKLNFTSEKASSEFDSKQEASDNSKNNRKNQIFKFPDEIAKNVTQSPIDADNFFPWNDGIDYKEFYWSLKRQFDRFKKPPIIHVGTNGGIGHQAGFLFSSVLIALQARRPLKLYMDEKFWNNTDSCMKSMRFTQEEWDNLNPSSLVTCSRNKRCRNDWYHSKKPVLFDDYFLPKLPSIETVNAFQLSMKFKDRTEFKHVIYRLFLNPKRDLQELILQHLKQYPKEFVGIHVRSGGKLANSKEEVGWIMKEDLPLLALFINSTITTRQYPTTVFLSTDSDAIEKYLKRHLPSLTFLPRLSLKRGHTTGASSSDTITTALFDAYIAAHSSVLFYTKQSSFSTMIKNLAHVKTFIDLPLKRRSMG